MPSISVQASPRDRTSWLALATDVEQRGFEGLWIGDHPGVVAAPFVSLAAAAAVTERIRLGTYVANAGVWEPVALATEVATLDVLSGGRAVLGLGAGHTPGEWTAQGRRFPSADDRVDRMIEVAGAVRSLLGGDVVSMVGRHVTLHDAVLLDPRPVQEQVPLLVGGSGQRVLRFGAGHAETVSVTGAGRTLADGHSHEVRWSAGDVARLFGMVGEQAQRAGRSPGIDVLVQHVELTDDAEGVAHRLAGFIEGASPGDLLSAPFVWIGTAAGIAAELAAHQRDLGVTSWTIRAPFRDQASQIRAIAAP